MNLKLVKHTIIYGLSPYAPKLLGIFILPIITKDLTQLDYGLYGIILAYVAGIEVFRDMGLNLIFYNSHTQMPKQFKWMWRSIYGFLTLWNLIYAILAAGLLYFTIPAEAKEHEFLIIILNVLPIVLFGPTSLIGKIYYQMEEQPMQIAWRTIVFGFLTIFLNLFTISYLKLGYMGWFWSTCIVTIGLNASFWYPINIKYKITPIFNFKWRLMKNNLKVSLPTVPHYYSNFIMRTSDKVILNMLKVSTESVGSYTFAGSFSALFNQLGLAIGQASRSTLNQNNKAKNYKANRDLIFNVQLIFFAATFLICIWLKEIFSLFINNDSLAATYPMAIILIMAANYRPMYLGATNYIFYIESTKKLMYITLIASISSVSLNLFLIPYFGVFGAVITIYVSLMYVGYSGYYLKEFRETKVKYYPLLWLLTTVLLTIASYYLVEFNFFIKTVITVFIFIFSLIIIKQKVKEVKTLL